MQMRGVLAVVVAVFVLCAVCASGEEQCAAGDATCAANKAPEAGDGSTAGSESESAEEGAGEEEYEGEEEDYDGGDYEDGDMGDMDWSALASAAGSLLGGGNGGGGGGDAMGGLGSLLGGLGGAGGMAGLAAAAAPLAGALLGGGGGGGLGNLASIAAGLAGGGGGDGAGGIMDTISNVMGAGGGEILGNVMGAAGMDELGSLVKNLDKDTLMKSANIVGDMIKKGPEGAMDDDAINKLYGTFGPIIEKGAEVFENVKDEFSKGGKDKMIAMVANFLGVDVGEGMEGDVQEKLIAKLLDPEMFRPTLLKAYRMFVLPMTAETAPRDETSSVLKDMDSVEGMISSVLSEDAQRSTGEIVMGRDYPVEEHIVKTPDDFKLTMYRIPHGKEEEDTKPRPAVFLMHALLDSSASFVAGPTESALAYALADEGYDVWLGNARGNVHSKFHRAVTPNSPKFWEWSWDEIATVDIPTMMEYIAANITTPLNFIGHSQGATAGLAALAAKPELAAKVNLFVAMAPVVSLKGSTSLLVQSFKDMVSEEQWLKELGSHEVFPHSKISTFVAAGCAMLPAVCTKLLSTMAGGKEENMDTETLSTHLAHTPAGTSVRNLAHWMQFAENDDSASGPRSFKHADGSGGQVYDFSAVNVPTAVYYGEDDAIVPSASVEALIGKLRNVVASKKVPSYGHVDFVWGRDTARAVNYELLATMNARNNLAPPQEPPELPPKPAAEPAAEPAAKPAAEPEPPAASDADCVSWAASGECSSNSAFMKETCLAACEDFFKSCRDVAAAEDCAAWKEAGECTANPEYMAENCAASCGRCAFSEGAEEAAPQAEPVKCEDEHDECKQWAKDGECQKNEEYMAEACPVSCNACK